MQGGTARSTQYFVNIFIINTIVSYNQSIIINNNNSIIIILNYFKKFIFKFKIANLLIRNQKQIILQILIKLN